MWCPRPFREAPRTPFCSYSPPAMGIPGAKLKTKGKAMGSRASSVPPNTKAKGCKNGSWELVGRWSGEGGRVYATAINVLTQQVH